MKPVLSTSWKLGLVSLNKPKIVCPWGVTDFCAPCVFYLMGFRRFPLIISNASGDTFKRTLNA